MTAVYATFEGHPTCDCMVKWLEAFFAELERRKLPIPEIYQLTGNASQSAGTHAGGGACDFHPLTWAQRWVLRQMGAHDGARTTAQGFSVDHDHLLLRGCPHLAPAAVDQWKEFNAGQDGLLDHKPDSGPVDPGRTWFQGIQWATAQRTLPTPHPAGPTPTTTKAVTMIDGNDESSYQSGVTRAPFHFFKASQGTTADPTYQAKVKDALANHELAGAYHYIDNSATILAQARFFVATCGGRAAAPKAADYEQAGVTEAAATEFIRTVQGLDPHNQVGEYESLAKYHQGQFVGDFLWIAAYAGKKEFILPNALFDQWTDKPIDQDIARFNSVADMWAWAHAKECVPIAARPAAVLQAQRELVMEIRNTTASTEWGRRARIANNVLRGVKNTGIPGVTNVAPSQHVVNAEKQLATFIPTTTAADPWGHRARIAYNALLGKH